MELFDENSFPKRNKSQGAKPAPKKIEAPKIPTVVDLAEVPVDKREQLVANAEIAGLEIKNRHLLEEAKKIREPQKAMLMEFPKNPPAEAQDMQPLFRLSRQRDLDILFCGLNIGPVFQDKVEAGVKTKFLNDAPPEEVANHHYVVFVYLAIALPFGENDSMSSGWSLTFFCPREFERIMPKSLREHLGIEIWWERTGQRFDAIYYFVQKVANEEEKETAIREAKRRGTLAWALLALGAPKPQIPQQTIERWVEEYYEKHPEERPNTQGTSPQEEDTPPPEEKATDKSPSATEAPSSPKPGEVISLPEPAEDDPIGSTHPAAKEAYEREQKNKQPAKPKPSSIF